MPKQFLIDEELAQAILDYLTTKPYCEVYELVRGLQQLSVASDATDQDLNPD
jgi:hypothetical protein